MGEEPVLCADIGNSRIHLAVFPPGRAVSRPARCIRRVAYCSVRPSAEAEFERPFLARGIRPLKLGRDLPIPVRVPRGWRPGADRLCNVLAAFERFRRACVVIDVGTAINAEFVSDQGDLVGGVIAPGLEALASSLRGRAELLPAFPSSPLAEAGRTTVDNLRAGLYASLRGTIRETISMGKQLLTRRFRERGRNPRIPVIGTGGGAPPFRDLFDAFDPLLTLRGVHLVWRNSPMALGSVRNERARLCAKGTAPCPATPGDGSVP